MKLTLISFALLVGGATQSFALNCGDPVSGNVTLTADLVCHNQNGLVVVADNTTINLNFHKIKCLGNGLAGSCQLPLGPPNPWYTGISSNGHNKVSIKGQGSIEGFTEGVNITGGSGHYLYNFFITGPSSQSLGNQRRGTAWGLHLKDISCGIQANFPGMPLKMVGGLVTDLLVTGYQRGVFFENASCVEMQHAYLNDIKGFHNSHGLVVQGNNNRIHNIAVDQVGWNEAYSDAGVLFAGPETFSNELRDATVAGNCANGVMVAGGASKNNIHTNYIKRNGTYFPTPGCPVPDNMIFFDITISNPGPNNIWNVDNKCVTQNPYIIGAVCSPKD